MKYSDIAIKLFNKLVKEPALIAHSQNVATASKNLAKALNLDSELAYCYGLLHDIGKVQKSKGLMHIYNGYQMLLQHQVIDKPDICLTHSFPLKNIHCYLGDNDCNLEQINFINNYISTVEYSLYDKIVQLSDAISGYDGFMILEISMVKAAFKYGTNQYTKELWSAYFNVYEELESLIGSSIYSLLPSRVNGYA